MPSSSLTDKQALIALYYATDGPNWWRKTKWLTDAPIWQWERVTVNNEALVKELDLTPNNLNGEHPPELGNL